MSDRFGRWLLDGPLFFTRLVVAILMIGVGTGLFARPSCAAADSPLADESHSSPPMHITGLSNYYHAVNPPTKSAPELSLNDYLAVTVDAKGPINPMDYVLFLNGRALDGLADTIYDSDAQRFVFHLQRNSTNTMVWSALLGSPGLAPVAVSVALGNKAEAGQSPVPTIKPIGEGPKGFSLVVLPRASLFLSTVVILIVCGLVWGRMKKTTILRDNLLPQVEPTQQPYSLGRWQMAFWFTLVFASFVFLFILLWDANTVTDQALMLMGISGATALAAVAVDASKETPVGAANTALRAIGLNSYADVVRVREEIVARENQLDVKPPPGADQVALLTSQITDRRMLLLTYDNKIKPFLSQGWYRDLTTDINGPALHRVQVFCWTWVLGVVFIIDVYQQLSMPTFNGTLLALMGISSAGYIGFKYPETQN